MILGRTLPSSRQVAWHEAYHAAALCLAGLVPRSVSIRWPVDFAAGDVEIDWGPGGYRDPTRAKDVLTAVVVAAHTEGKEGWEITNWPIDPFLMAEGGRGDAAVAGELFEHFGLDQVDWCQVLWKADKLGRRRDFRRLVVRIARALEPVDVLYADDLRALMEPSEAVAALCSTTPTGH